MYFILALPAIIGIGFMFTAVFDTDVFLGPRTPKGVMPADLLEDIQHCQDDVEMFYHAINGPTP